MMFLKAKALVVGLMMAGGVAAPVITYHATQPAERPLSAKADLAPEIEPPPATESTVTRVDIESVEVRPGPKPVSVVAAVVAPAPKAEPAPAKKCEKRQLQTVASGAVVICDVDRSSSGKVAGGLFAPIEKPATLVPRDLPSPTGLIR